MSSRQKATAAKKGASLWLMPDEWVIGVGVGLKDDEYVIKVLCTRLNPTWPVEWDGVPIVYEEGHQIPKAQTE